MDVIAPTRVEQSCPRAAVGGGLHREMFRMEVVDVASCSMRLALHVPVRLACHSARVKPPPRGPLWEPKLHVQSASHARVDWACAAAWAAARAVALAPSRSGGLLGCLPTAKACLP